MFCFIMIMIMMIWWWWWLYDMMIWYDDDIINDKYVKIIIIIISKKNNYWLNILFQWWSGHVTNCYYFKIKCSSTPLLIRWLSRVVFFLQEPISHEWAEQTVQILRTRFVILKLKHYLSNKVLQQLLIPKHYVSNKAILHDETLPTGNNKLSIVWRCFDSKKWFRLLVTQSALFS
jgi:hypothetical protein